MKKPVRPIKSIEKIEKELFNKVKIGSKEYEFRQSLVVPSPEQFANLLYLSELQFTEGNLNFNEDGLTLDVMDAANISRGKLIIKKEFFRDYVFRRANIGINLHHLITMLNSFPRDTPVKIYDLLAFRLGLVGKGAHSQRSFLIPMIEIGQKEQKTITPKTGVVLNMSTKLLNNILAEFNTKLKATNEEAKSKYQEMFYGANVKVITEKPDKISFILYTKDKSNLAERKITLGKEITGVIKQNVNNNYSFDYLKTLMILASKIFPTVRVSTENKDILDLLFQSEKYSYQYDIAPRVLEGSE